MRLPYIEGSWFTIPLSRGFGVGLVARSAPSGKVIFCYFFGGFMSSPTLEEVRSLSAPDALLVGRVGDLYLLKGRWPVLGTLEGWNRENWPMPIFRRVASLSSKSWLVVRSDEDPNKIVSEEPVSSELPENVPRDQVFGAGALEVALSKLVEGSDPSRRTATLGIGIRRRLT
jgi:hypothetical protein